MRKIKMTCQAIVTKYIGPTNTKGSRIKASCEAGSITIQYPSQLSEVDAHKEAFVALAKKLDWDKYTWHVGGLKNGYVFVLGEL
jgi:hypothetical protein